MTEPNPSEDLAAIVADARHWLSAWDDVSHPDRPKSHEYRLNAALVSLSDSLEAERRQREKWGKAIVAATEQAATEKERADRAEPTIAALQDALKELASACGAEVGFDSDGMPFGTFKNAEAQRLREALTEMDNYVKALPPDRRMDSVVLSLHGFILGALAAASLGGPEVPDIKDDPLWQRAADKAMNEAGLLGHPGLGGPEPEQEGAE